MTPEQLKDLLSGIIENVCKEQDVSREDILSALSSTPVSTINDGTSPTKDKMLVVDEKDAEDMGAAYAKADSAFTSMGMTAPMPWAGEKALDYRKRALIKAQIHTPKFRDVNIRSISDSAALGVVEEQIYKAAADAVSDAMDNTPGYLSKSFHFDGAGRRITEYRGDPCVWLNYFKIPSRRMVPGSLNTR